MPIKGLSDRGLAFSQIGNIRKGGAKDPSANRPGPDLKWFRVEFDAKETETEELFKSLYGLQPNDIDIVLPFDDIEQVWDPWCEAYTAGRMVARSDGEFFVWWVNPTTGEQLVVNGLDKNGQRVPHQEVVGHAGKSDIKCRPVGRLKIIIPALRRAAYLVVHTTSVIDIRNISEQLRAIQALNGGHIAGVPLVLRRRPKMVSCPDPSTPGKKVRREKYMISIEADPKWVSKMLAHMDNAALPAGDARPALPAIPEELDEDVEWGEVDGDIDTDYIPVDAEQEEAPQEMTLEEAESMTNKNGKRYGDLDTAALEQMYSILNDMSVNPGADTAEIGRRMLAIGMVLTSREAENE